MLRIKIANKITEKDVLILKLNHNYFVRTAIVTVAKLTIAAVILVVGIAILNYWALNAKTSSDANSLVAAYIILYLSYIVYFVVQVASLISLYHRGNSIEDQILFGREAKNMKHTLYESSSSASLSNDSDDDDDL